ncbi:MAG: TonB-dependent receptor [Giesbergeria sp.]
MATAQARTPCRPTCATTDDSEFGGKGTGSLSYGYAFAPSWRATASVGTAFRAPTLYQRFSEYGDATLRPESSRNAELGAALCAAAASSFSAVAYRNRVSNLIIVRGGQAAARPAFGCYANTAQRRIFSGVTLAALAPASRVCRCMARSICQNPRDLDTGKQLARRAKRHATLGADTQMAGWTLGAELQASGRRFDNAANTNVLGGYTLVNLYASTRVAPRLYACWRASTTQADKDYQTARTYATGGRQLYIGLKWEPRL